MKPAIGRVLISEPFLPDPNFSRSVILLVEHNNEGSIGYVLNHKTDYAVNILVADMEVVNNSAFQGGPVDLESFHYIHSYPNVSGCSKITDSLFWSGDFEDVKEGLRTGKYLQENFIFFVGYSGWAPGQLQTELDAKSWVVAALKDQDVLDLNTDSAQLWKKAMRETGGSNVLLVNSPIDPSLN
mgnify:CR=1 FL=1